MKPIQTQTRLKLMKELIGNVENKIILDIGIMDINISKDFNPKKILTLDILPELKPDILYDLNNTKEKIPLEDNSIDIIIAGEVIEHLIDPNKVISEFHRILKSDGILVISTPNICSLVNRIKMLFADFLASLALLKHVTIAAVVLYPLIEQNQTIKSYPNCKRIRPQTRSCINVKRLGFTPYS